MYNIVIHVSNIIINNAYVYKGIYYPQLYLPDIHLLDNAYSKVLWHYFTESDDLL